MARRKIWMAVTALCLAASLVLSACGGGGTRESSGPASLRMTVWTANEESLKVLNDIAGEYVAANSDKVKEVKFETIPGDSYTTGLMTQLAGGNPPDLGWILETNAREFIENGTLVDLAPGLKAKADYQYDDLNPAAMQLWKSGDAMYAYPFSTSPFSMLVNLDLFKQAGQPTPAELIESGQWTWPKLREVSSAVASKTGKAGMLFGSDHYTTWQNLASIWNGWGASVWSADGTTCTAADPEMVEAMRFIHDSIFDSTMLPRPGNSADFFAGGAGLLVATISQVAKLDDSFEWDLVPLPDGPAGPVKIIGQAGMGVFSKGKNTAAAQDFLAYLTSPENAKKLAAFYPPPRKSLVNADTLKAANAKLSKEQLQAAVVDRVEGATPLQSHVNFAKLQQAVRAGLDPMWKPDADVSGVLTALCESIKSDLNS